MITAQQASENASIRQYDSIDKVLYWIETFSKQGKRHTYCYVSESDIKTLLGLGYKLTKTEVEGLTQIKIEW